MWFRVPASVLASREAVFCVAVLVTSGLPIEAAAEVIDKIPTIPRLGWLLASAVVLAVFTACVATRWPIPVLIAPAFAVVLGAEFIQEMFFSMIADAVRVGTDEEYRRLAWLVGLSWLFGPSLGVALRLRDLVPRQEA